MPVTKLCCGLTLRRPINLDDGEIALSQFKQLRVVGQGTYARVRIVECKHTRAYYALKYMDKSRCAKNSAVSSILRERSILGEINHPFLVNLHFAFQDDTYCYLVLDLMLGGNLRFHRVNRGSLGENAVRFYIAEISCALAFLHERGICHRDVKPENILLDHHGHAHLGDFNVAIHYSKDFDRDIAGTPVYMAPEMLTRTGYSWQIDYWALGVTAYECLFFGRRPFAHGCKDVKRLGESIMYDSLVFPKDTTRICSPEGRDAVAALLDRGPGIRLGCTTRSPRLGQTRLREHPWFRDIDWGKLEALQLAPPFVPDKSDWNYEDFDESLVDRTLIARMHRLSHVSEKVFAEHHRLEKNFLPFEIKNSPNKGNSLGPQIDLPWAARVKRRSMLRG